ncbi:MAG TPA: pitrilysin family protein, partial [Ignavibacteria bacterium]|nr:pitrilysin family protein [Ignavibacteria bacterium]
NNAFTNEDKTNYFIILPSHSIDLGLWLESDRMLAFSVTNDSLNIQKEVVIEEKKQVYDNKPYGSLSLEFPPRLYKSGGYSWDTIGYTDDIKSATLLDVKKFYENFYVPNNAVLSIAGNFDKDKIIESINKYFGCIKPGNIVRNSVPDYEFNTGEITDIIYDKIQVPGIFMGYKIPKENSREHYIFEIISEVLSTGESSRFYRNLVYDKQLVSEIGSYVDAKESAGTFYIYSILMPGVKPEEAEAEINTIINDVITNGISEKELLKVKNRIETGLTYRMQTIINKADILAHFEAFFDNAGMVNSIIDNYLKITINDIFEQAKKYLSTDNRVVLKYLPYKFDNKIIYA